MNSDAPDSEIAQRVEDHHVPWVDDHIVHWVEDHHADLYRYAFRLTGSTADAEDLTQQTFLSALSRRKAEHHPAQVRPWLYAILRHAWIKTLRKPLMLAEDHDLSLDLLVEEETESDVDSERLQSALGRLSDESRLILVMFYFEELSYREIAEALSVPMGTVMSRLSRAKQALRHSFLESQRVPLEIGTLPNGTVPNGTVSTSVTAIGSR